MSTAGALWKHLLDLARRPVHQPGSPGQPKQMWLERPWDWHDANLYRRGQR